MIDAARVTRFGVFSTVIIILATSSVALLGMTNSAFAQGVSIHPKRVVFEGRERSTTIDLINRGDQVVTYRLGFQNIRVDDQGQREVVEDRQAGEMLAEELIRFSPRQVTLRPRESQRVRLMTRKPADLAEGEYRSHLRFQALPAVQSTPQEIVDGEEMRVSMEMRTHISIPIIIRHGEVDAEVELTSVEHHPEEEAVSFTLQRQGERSVYGDLEVSHISENGDEILVGVQRGVAVYTPNGVRRFRLPMQLPEGEVIGDGELRVQFSEAGRHGAQAEWRGAWPTTYEHR